MYPTAQKEASPNEAWRKSVSAGFCYCAFQHAGEFFA